MNMRRKFLKQMFELDDAMCETYLKNWDKVLDTLTDREKKIINMRMEGKALKECGNNTWSVKFGRLGVSVERVRQIEAKACRKLRHPHRRKMWGAT